MLPNSFTLFEFPMKIKNLLASIESTPLPIEAVDISTGSEIILGVAAVHLSEVMKTRPTGTEAGGVLFVWENYIAIHAYEPMAEEQRQLGFVRVMLTLEDRGGIQLPTNQDHMHDHMKQEGFAAALELDLWLRAEMDKFRQELIDTETTTLQEIEKEWRNKEQKREEEFKLRESEFLHLKHQLEENEIAITEREKKVEHVEYELARKAESLKVEYERKMAEANDVIERMKDDFAHKAEAERRKREAMGSTNKLLENEISASERKLKQTEDDLMEFRRRMESSPSTLLQAELASLAAEKMDIQRKVDQATNTSKANRQKLLKAYQELSRLKNQALAAKQQRLQREHEELEALRIHAMAQQHNKLLHGEKVELLGLKKELQQLKKKELEDDDSDISPRGEGESIEVEDLEAEDEYESPTSSPLRKLNISNQNGHLKISADASENEKRLQSEVTRLTTERDTLLNTGLYSTEDRVITIIQKALDLQTQRLREELLKKERAKNPPPPPSSQATTETTTTTTKTQKPHKLSTIAKKLPPKTKLKQPSKPRMKT